MVSHLQHTHTFHIIWYIRLLSYCANVIGRFQRVYDFLRSELFRIPDYPDHRSVKCGGAHLISVVFFFQHLIVFQNFISFFVDRLVRKRLARVSVRRSPRCPPLCLLLLNDFDCRFKISHRAHETCFKVKTLIFYMQIDCFKVNLSSSNAAASTCETLLMFTTWWIHMRGCVFENFESHIWLT